MSVKVAAFDFDGVIVDSLPENYKLYLKAFEAVGEHLDDTPEVFEQVKKARVFFKSVNDHLPALKKIKEGFDFGKINQDQFNKLILENPDPRSEAGHRSRPSTDTG